MVGAAVRASVRRPEHSGKDPIAVNWERSYLIGRDTESDAVLPDKSVSRRHAKLVLDGKGGLYLADLDSKFGTFVHRGGNWKRLRQDFVGLEEPVRFGNHQTTPGQLLEHIRHHAAATTPSTNDAAASMREVTVLVADVVGYSRMMSQDPGGTLDALKTCRRDAVDPTILHHRGRIFGEAGDAICAEFREAADAVRAAHAIQSALRARTFGQATMKIEMRIGIDAGAVMVEKNNLFGSAVNIAARLQALARPGRICTPASVMEKAAALGFRCADLGEKPLKNIPYPIRVYEFGPE